MCQNNKDNMKKVLFALFLITHALSLLGENQKLVYKINIRQDINSHSVIHLQNGLNNALKHSASCVIIDMNTFGGGLAEADSMRTAILNSPIPTYVFINSNAASAGALISIACDSIYMRPSGTIGAATVVTQDGEKAPDKYQSYMRGLMRSTAESHGKDSTNQWKRNPLIAEAMVDERVVIPNLIDSTKVLTLTASEAVEQGYCEGVVSSIDELIHDHLGYDDYNIETYNPTWFDYIKGFLSHGAVQSILIMVIIGGFFFELKSPGTGVPIALAITAAVLYFMPLYMSGQAQNWEVIIFVLGLILIAFEIFVIPGFGVAGISGIICVVLGLLLAMIDNVDFDFQYVSSYNGMRSVLTVFSGLLFSFGIILYLSSRIGKKGPFKHVALLTDQEGYISVPTEPMQLVGKAGVASTDLRPSGTIIVDGDYYDAVSVNRLIEKGSDVKVLKYENSQLYVKQI